MGRTVGNFCSRDFVYSLQPYPLAPSLDPVIDIPMEQNNDAMTWQQKRDFGDAAVSERVRTGLRLALHVDPTPHSTSHYIQCLRVFCTPHFAF